VTVSATPTPGLHREPIPSPSSAGPRTLYEQLRQISMANADRTAYRVPRNGDWVDIPWSEHARSVARISKSLLALGIEKGERVSILSGTRLEWVQCDAAIVGAGAVTVGIYHSNLAPDCSFILEHSGAMLAFVEDATQLEKVLSVRQQLSELRHIVVFDGADDTAQGVLSWKTFLERGAGIDDSKLEERGRSIEPDDLASLVYTSGTTGTPKGAMITHENLVFVSASAGEALAIQPHYTTLLFLPLAHVFARMIVYMCQGNGVCVAFTADLSKVAARLSEIRPHFIASVPRIYEKVHERILGAVEQAGGRRRRLFDWAVEVGRQASRRRLAGKPLGPWLATRLAIADRLALHKVRNAFGGRLCWGVSGAAPLNVSVNEFFNACGVTIIEGLGMTENTSLSNANRLYLNKLGTVGPTVPGVEMKLAADGEVLFRGPNTMAGYYKDPVATAEAIDADGWLHSGDIGKIDEDGYLTITDRKKDIIITAGGKNVAPQRIEKILRASRYLSQVVACGDRRKFISALVTLDLANVRQWAGNHDVTAADDAVLIAHPRVRELIEQEIARCNEELASFESVKQFRILPQDLSIESGELTPTLKVKRKVVCDKYAALLDEIYGT